MKTLVFGCLVFLNLMYSYFAADVSFNQAPRRVSHTDRVKPVGSGSCKCVSYNCGCCLHLNLPKFDINDTSCVNFTYLVKDYGIRVTFSIDGKILIKEEVSASHPPPICINFPHLQKEASLCLDFYNLSLRNHYFSGCVDLTARLYHVVSENIKLGCFKMKLPFGKRHVIEMRKLKRAVRKNHMQKL